jgi:hypothetical protein
MEKKNVAMSVRAKLLNIRNSVPGTDYMQVLLRYIQERMLYRLSMSQYRDNFCLKGSALLFAYEKFKARPTKNIDFLGDKMEMLAEANKLLDAIPDYDVSITRREIEYEKILFTDEGYILHLDSNMAMCSKSLLAKHMKKR